MNSKIIKWSVFIFIAVVAILSQVFVQQRYTTLLQGGAEYQWPVVLQKSSSWAPVDYVNVRFLGNTAPWVGQRLPQMGEPIYVDLAVKPTGMLAVENASFDKPTSGEYVLARTKRVENGIVEFDIPFNRAHVDLAKVNPAFYTNYKGTLVATLKLKNGQGVITGIYSKGVPLEMAQPESIENQSKDMGHTLDDIINAKTADDIKVDIQPE